MRLADGVLAQGRKSIDRRFPTTRQLSLERHKVGEAHTPMFAGFAKLKRTSSIMLTTIGCESFRKSGRLLVQST